MYIAITGHRPSKLGNDYTLTSPLILSIKQRILDIIDDDGGKFDRAKNEMVFITGMALGIDTLFARIAVERDIPFIAAIPFKGQEKAWRGESVDEYFKLLQKAKYIAITDVQRGNTAIQVDYKTYLELPFTHYAPAKMQVRNMWMVNSCNYLIAVWDGSAGGTANCVNYASNLNTKPPIVRINPLELNVIV